MREGETGVTSLTHAFAQQPDAPESARSSSRPIRPIRMGDVCDLRLVAMLFLTHGGLRLASSVSG